MTEWTLPYEPRAMMLPFHQRTQRNAFLICHRRFGKTVGCVGELVIRAMYSKKKNPQYAYIAPFRSQAKAVAWQYLVDMTAGIATEVKVSELSVTLPNGAKIWLSGSDNVNALRGLYLDGCVIDEYAQCRPDLLQAVILPCLLDRKGWLVVIGTAYGRLNDFFNLYEESRDSDDWYHADIKVTDSGVIPESEQKRLQRSVSDAKWKQEMMNDFSAELIGTYYSTQINELEANGQISDEIVYQPELPVHTAMDIGRKDATVIWFWQETPHGINVIDYYMNNGLQAQHYIDFLKGKPYVYASINLPHDAKAMTFTTDKSALEQFMDAWLNTDTRVQLVPKLSVADGIEAVRQTLRYTHFNIDTCYYGIECLRVYRKSWDAVKQVFAATPLHDYASDPADAFRYLSVMANMNKLPAPDPHTAAVNALIANGEYSLDKLHAERHEITAGSSISRSRI